MNKEQPQMNEGDPNEISKIKMNLEKGFYDEDKAYIDADGLHITGSTEEGEFDYIKFSSDAFERLNSDRGEKIVGQPLKLYLKDIGVGSDWGTSLWFDKEMAKEPVPNRAYQNPDNHPHPQSVFEMEVSLTEMGNPMIKIDEERAFRLYGGGDYVAMIRPGVMTPESALQDGIPGLNLREMIIGDVERELLDRGYIKREPTKNRVPRRPLPPDAIEKLNGGGNKVG